MGSDYTCLGVTLIDFVLKRYKNFYLQRFLKEYKYIKKEKIRRLDILPWPRNFSDGYNKKIPIKKIKKEQF